MHWSLGKQISPRGAGLGNEIFPWAKAYLAAQALNMRYLDPPWRLNPRRYDRHLDGGALAAAQYAACRLLPSADVTREVYRSTGAVDYFDAMMRLPPSYRESSRPVLIHSSGMAGGYLAIRRARTFLRGAILGSKDAVQAMSVLDVHQQQAVRVAVHVRGGDFHNRESVEKEVFNQTLPLEWYRTQIETLTSSLTIPVQVFLATDGKVEDVSSALTIGGERPTMIGTSSISDLAVLAGCDLLVSSVSSFSMLAAFLSDSPYIWHRDQLGDNGGWLSIWGHEQDDEGGGPTAASVTHAMTASPRVYRGRAHSMQPTWPTSLLNYLAYRAQLRSTQTDLIQYGVVPVDELQQ